MKKYLIPALALATAWAFAGCRQAEQADTLPVIDMGKEYPEKELVVQDLFDVEYVPLETSDEFVTQGEVLDISEHFVAVKNWNNDGNLYLFDRQNGRGVRCINRRGQSGGEYTYLGGVVLDEAGGELFVVDASVNKILVYDWEGRFRRNVPLREGFVCHTVMNYDKEHLIVYDASAQRREGEPPSQPYYHAVISKQDGHVERALPVHFAEAVGPYVWKGDMVAVAFPPAAIVPNRGDWLLVEISADTVYNYVPSEDEMEPFLVTLPSAEPERLFCMSTVTDRYYFMQGMRKEFDPVTGKGFSRDDWMYDRQEKAVYTPVVRNADFKDGREANVIDSPVNRHGVAALQVLSADELVTAYEDGELNEGPLKDIASRLGAEDNPVLMLMKYKK